MSALLNEISEMRRELRTVRTCEANDPTDNDRSSIIVAPFSDLLIHVLDFFYINDIISMTLLYYILEIIIILRKSYQKWLNATPTILIVIVTLQM